MMHVTFRTPLPRVLVMQRSTEIIAANAAAIDNALLTASSDKQLRYFTLACRSLLPRGGERELAMKIDLIVHADMIASVVGTPESKT